MPESLAVRRAATSTAITRVHQVLDAFAARDHNGEMLTAIRHFPAREAQWAEFPAWVNADLAGDVKEIGVRRAVFQSWYEESPTRAASKMATVSARRSA